MKKVLLISIIALCSIAMSAKNVTINSTDGRSIVCELVSYTDTSVVIMMPKTTEKITVSGDKIINITSHRKQIFISRDGVLVKLSDYETPLPSYRHRYSTTAQPNVVIGNEMMNIGKFSLVVGVPCLAAGLATCIAGHSGSVPILAASDCIDASYYLFGAGAAMTIIGVPLYVKGKKISELRFQCSGNGVGVAVGL